MARVSEKTEQAHGVQLVRSIGGKAYVVGGHRRRGDYQGTMQSPGIPDVMFFLPQRRFATVDPGTGQLRADVTAPMFLFWEAKATGGRVRREQQEFRGLCQDAGVEHLVGDFNALIAWLVARHYVKADQFPHYRHPPADSALPDPRPTTVIR